MNGLERISIKILTDAPPGLKLDPFLSIFGRWRKETSHPAQWVDLADYAHMPRGPGIVLIGKRANFSFDMGGEVPGVLYASKKDLTGSPEARLSAVFAACLEMSRRLIAEPEFPSGVSLRAGELELIFNDRLETPNTPGTDRVLAPVASAVLDRLFGAGWYRLRPESDPARRYGLSIQAKQAPSLDSLIARLAISG
jgi:hypothetical protein